MLTWMKLQKSRWQFSLNLSPSRIIAARSSPLENCYCLRWSYKAASDLFKCQTALGKLAETYEMSVRMYVMGNAYVVNEHCVRPKQTKSGRTKWKTPFRSGAIRTNWNVHLSISLDTDVGDVVMCMKTECCAKGMKTEGKLPSALLEFIVMPARSRTIVSPRWRASARGWPLGRRELATWPSRARPSRPVYLPNDWLGNAGANSQMRSNTTQTNTSAHTPTTHGYGKAARKAHENAKSSQDPLSGGQRSASFPSPLISSGGFLPVNYRLSRRSCGKPTDALSPAFFPFFIF